MFWNKHYRETDKLILNSENMNEGAGSSEITVKIDSKEQLFSSYSYSDDKLNSEFSEYLFDKAKSLPLKENIKIKIYTQESINADDVEQTLKNHYRTAYKEAKKEVKRISVISAIMTLFGLIALTVLILVNHFTDSFYITSIAEIVAWVFIWEAVDYFFLQRPVAKAKCILIQRIYTSEVEICEN